MSLPFWISWGCATISIVAALVSVLNLRLFRSRRAYRRGWVEGRQAMALALVEALNRGLSLREFIATEAERDGYAVTFRYDE